MWDRAIRGFVITSLVVNGALTMALITAMAGGVRPVTILDLAACAGLLFGFLNAVGDLVEAEYPVDDADELAPTAPVLHLLRQRGKPTGPIPMIFASKVSRRSAPNADASTNRSDCLQFRRPKKTDAQGTHRISLGPNRSGACSPVVAQS